MNSEKDITGTEFKNIIAVTDRHLCRTDFYMQIEKLCKIGIGGIILREKELSESEYERMALKVKLICDSCGTTLMLHTHIAAAKRLKHGNIHLTMHDFRKCKDCADNVLDTFEIIGVSTHTVEEAAEAEKMGASYITASHIYETECKPGIQPRGIDYLRSVTEAVSIPVYALGGIHMDNMDEPLLAGAGKVCMMSEMMRL